MEDKDKLIEDLVMLIKRLCNTIDNSRYEVGSRVVVLQAREFLLRKNLHKSIFREE